MRTQAIEDYLKAIYELHEEEGAATTSALASRLGVAPASATVMVKKLASLKLVDHEPYRGVVLRKPGKKIALEVIRHHRLVESFLSEVLGVPWDEVHAEAERWEHVLSEELEERIDERLGFPTSDPHGAPIPARNGAITRPASVPLAELDPGQTATIVEVSDRDPDLLRYVAGLGLVPGATLTLVAAEPFDGPLRVAVEGEEHAVGREVAADLLVAEVVPSG
jgi:DtxR family transcriptional regulator, Mn-dependent transcriptional regulator